MDRHFSNDDLPPGLRIAREDPCAADASGPAVDIPDHQLVRCIGKGSYGEVWLARNMMGIYRAVKIVCRKSFASHRPFERELTGIRKFEPISRSHEGFIDILHVGINEEKGYFFYVMELGDDEVSGQQIQPERYQPKTLASEITRRSKLAYQDCLQLGLAMSQALAELHKHGLVHRDVKPSNIIFVNGAPKLADIGLVEEVEQARSYVGTEGFIPPEGPGTPQADVYSLGKVLYEASTGKDRQEFPELPTLFDEAPEHELLVELNEVILQACKNDLAKRYRSAEQLEADLLVLANGQSVKRLKVLERRWAQAKRATVIALSVSLALLALFYQVYREWQRANESRLQRVGADLVNGNQRIDSGDLVGALPYLADGLRLDQGYSGGEVLHRLRFGSALAQCPKPAYLWPAATMVRNGEFSPDGQKIVIALCFDKAQIYDLQSGEMRGQPFGHRDGLYEAAFSPDGQRIVTANEDGSACIWDATTATELRHLSNAVPIYSARFSADGQRIVTAADNGSAYVWDAQQGRIVLTIKAHTNTVRFACFSRDDRLIVTTSDDCTVRLWDAQTGQPVGPILRHGKWVVWAAFSPDNQRLATASLDRKARVWDVATGRRIPPDLAHPDGVRSVDFSPDGRLLATACWDGAVRLWHAEDLRPLEFNPVLRHGERAERACFSPDSHLLLVTCTAGPAWIWDLASVRLPPAPLRASISQDGSKLVILTNHGFQVCDGASGQPAALWTRLDDMPQKLELTRNGGFILASGFVPAAQNLTNCWLQVWDAGTAEPLGPRLAFTNLAGSSLADDGKRLVTFTGTHAQVWDIPAGTAVSPLLPHLFGVSLARFDRAGTRLATVSRNQVRIWHSMGGTNSLLLQLPWPVEYVEFSPDGSRLVTCGCDNLLNKCSAQVWDALTGQAIGSPLEHRDGVRFAAFSPDGQRVVTASEDFFAILWDARTGRQLAPALHHADQVKTAAFSPDGKWIVTASSDKTARVWNAETGDPLTPPLPHLLELTGAAFLAEGRRIMTTDIAGNAFLWDLPIDPRPTGELVNLARLMSGGNDAGSRKLNATPPRPLEDLWRELKAQNPQSFATTRAQLAAWHDYQAQASERDGEWFAAAFHLECLSKLRPEDSALRARLARAKENLDGAN